jgi:hypothetical protein
MQESKRLASSTAASITEKYGKLGCNTSPVSCHLSRPGSANMDLSYTQNMEDYHLWLAFGGQRNGTYIDIGAGHPIADNVSFFFYERGWQGLVVEPQRNLVDLHTRLRPRDISVCALIGTRSGLTET